MSKDALT